MECALITGAAGFIGSNLCHYILKNTDWEVVGIDNFSTGSNVKNLPISSRFSCYREDINYISQIKPIFHKEKPSIIFHLAASSHVDRSLDSDLDFWQTNVIGTRNVLTLCQQYKPRVIINQQSDEPYGPIPHGQPAALEGDKFCPTSPYACSKAAQYYVGRSKINTSSLPIIHTFPCNVFGPRQWPEKIIPKFLLRLFEGRKVPLMKNTRAEREWMYTDDHCKALVFLAQNGIVGEDYNISSGFHINNEDLTNKLLELTGRDQSFIEIVPDRTTHDCRYALNGDKLIRLGWNCNENEERFNADLQETTDWYQENYKDFYPSFY